MNKQPFDDQELLVFLRQHRPVPPAASPDLEEQLMKAIACNSNHINYQQTQSTVPKLLKQRQHQLWLFSSTIAAGLLITWSSFRFLTPSPEFTNANLESFLETNWNDVMGNDHTPVNNSQKTDWML